ncbi:hypothetical protein COLO4_29073 [Corchorus olitorius]|uniref:Endonuclease/exonuclease/phosphatase n=1 Tax=Corchorus olitorius TaxID=93759 RepID=A0A1R3HGC1_9ROSI|nr:hypothetical protein COLO4_29073 [Corchorus olitorius]
MVQASVQPVQGGKMRRTIRKNAVKQGEGNKSSEPRGGMMESNIQMGGALADDYRSNKEICNAGQEVDMGADQTNKEGETVVFKARRELMQNEEGSQNSKKWKRAVRTSNGMESCHSSKGTKVSGKKRSGLKGNIEGERKKSREDGELVSDSISEFNTQKLAEIIEGEGSSPWRFTGFYGNPITQRREGSWDLIRLLKEQSRLPWVIGGDFNEITDGSEKVGGQVRPFAQVEAFRNVIS